MIKRVLNSLLVILMILTNLLPVNIGLQGVSVNAAQAASADETAAPEAAASEVQGKQAAADEQSVTLAGATSAALTSAADAERASAAPSAETVAASGAGDVSAARVELPSAALFQGPVTPVSGVAFLDYNGDGFRSTTSQNPYNITTPDNVNGSNTTGLWPVDVGVAGITVTAYISGTMTPVAGTSTDASGAYTLSLPSGQAYQIVFSGYQDLGYTEGPLGRLTVTGTGAAAQVEPSAYTNNSVTVEPSVGNGFVIVNLTAGAALNSKVHFGLVKAELYSNVAPRVA